MVRNVYGGNKAKKKARAPKNNKNKQFIKINKGNDNDNEPDENLSYGKIDKPCGVGRFDVICDDGHRRNCGIPGKFKNKRVKINKDDIVLLEYNDGTDKNVKGEIIYKYDENEISRIEKEDNINFKKLLKREGEIVDDEDTGIVFKNDSDEEEDEENGNNNLNSLEIDLDEI